MFTAFLITVFNPATGAVYVDSKTVTAKSESSARHKAIAALTEVYNTEDAESGITWPQVEGETISLSALLDLVNSAGVAVIPLAR